MGLENRILYNLVDVLTGRCRVKQALIRDKRYPNLWIIPSSCSGDSKNNLNEKQMKNLLSDLRKEFDYVLIDSPAGIDGGFKLATAVPTALLWSQRRRLRPIHDADCVIQLLHRKKVPRIDLLVNGYRRQMVRDGNMLDIPDICELLGSGASGCCSGRRGDYHQPEPRGTGDREAYGFRHLLPEYCTPDCRHGSRNTGLSSSQRDVLQILLAESCRKAGVGCVIEARVLQKSG